MLLTARAIAAAITLGLGALACSSSTAGAVTTAGDGGTTSSGAGSCKTYTACDVLTASDVGGALGGTYAAGKEDDLSPTPSATQAEEVVCVYSAPSTGGAYASINVRCCPCGDNEPAVVRSTAVGTGATVTDVSGVGDTAFWSVLSAKGLPVTGGTLYVFIGQDLFLTVNVGAGTSFTGDPMTAAKKLALDAIARL